MPKKILIIGGSAAGASAAAKARRCDETAEITMIEKGPYISYASCGIPFYVGGDIKHKMDLIHHTPESFFDRYRVNVVVDCCAISIDRANKIVYAKSGDRDSQFNYDSLVLATGTENILPPIDGIDRTLYFHMRSIADGEKIYQFIRENKVKKAAIIGGGYIGIEAAEALYNCNIEVVVIEALDMILANYPKLFAKEIKKEMERCGLKVNVNRKVKKIEQKGKVNNIYMENDEVVEVDMIILATGVKPNIKIAKECGLTIDDTGGLMVNENMQTNDISIYAAGDAVSKKNIITQKRVLLPLAGPANREGRIAGCNAAGGNMKFPGVIGTSIVRFNGLVLAGCGITLESALKEGFDVDYVYIIQPHHTIYYPGAEDIFLEVVFDRRSGKILGSFAIGKQDIARRIDMIATAIYGGMCVDDLAYVDYCYAPPFGTPKDIVNIAGYVAGNIIRNEFNCVNPEDVIKNKIYNAQILDVRNYDEVKKDSFKGALNIPLGDLRDSLDELDKNRPVVTFCSIGYRSYLAVKILQNNGFEAYNIKGGFNSLKKILEDK